ncbi:MAG TPA: transposase domain-containing protein [Gemmataceae bacterium]|nr:transposase domain-containing protein [Gemmataceae bacterium]
MPFGPPPGTREGTCRRLGLDPFASLRDALARLPAMPARRIDESLPTGRRICSRASLAATGERLARPTELAPQPCDRDRRLDRPWDRQPGSRPDSI